MSEQCASVVAWRRNHERHWGKGDDFTTRVSILTQFCDLIGKDPDAIVAECFRDTGDGKQIRLRARRDYLQAITDFERTSGRRAANVIRSFLNHNGVALSADVSWKT